MKYLLWIIAIFSVTSIGYGQKDSLMEAWGVYEKLSAPALSQKDTALALEIQQEVLNSVMNDPQEAMHRSHLLLKLSKKLNFPNGVAAGLLQTANTHMALADFDSAEYYVDKAILYCQQWNRKRQLMVSYSMRGNLNYYRSNYEDALNDYFEALEMAEKYYPKEVASKYANVGLIFWTIDNAVKAEEYLEKSYKMAKINEDTLTQMYALNNLGIALRKQKKYDEAEKYYKIGLELSVAQNNLRREGEFVYNLANVYFDTDRSDEGFKLLERSREITLIIGNDRDKAIEYANYGEHLAEAGKYAEAYPYLLDGLKYARISNYWEVIIEALEILSISSYELGRYRDAYEYSLELKEIRDSLNLDEINSDALAIEDEYEAQQEALKDSLLKDKYELERQHQKNLNQEKVKSREYLLYGAIGVITIVIIGLVFLFRVNKKVNQKNEIITERNNLITRQKEEIEDQHQEIKDSINYAQRIQNALISGNEEWDKISIDHFILFKPKDVVSGDFYWAHHSESDNISIWATADCTGHGVPGAFMSMLGIGFLNEIIIENNEREGSVILNKLREKIINSLRQKNAETQQRDGMDMALCIWNRNTNELEFTGANNGLYLIRKSELINESQFDKCVAHPTNGYSLAEIRANKMPVGFQSDKMESFVSNTLKLEKGDMLITFTDGFADQFGGEKGRKLKYKPFKEMLLEINQKPIKLQGEILDQEFNQWKGTLEQVDDVCVIGVRV